MVCPAIEQGADSIGPSLLMTPLFQLLHSIHPMERRKRRLTNESSSGHVQDPASGIESPSSRCDHLAGLTGSCFDLVGDATLSPRHSRIGIQQDHPASNRDWASSGKGRSA